ncbi:hypothetical protein [Motilibacter deserti]|uniref:Uncharacterized protein n=1 Tax=Motilibacter deserti TaxID=2714956 RepID=A0ABX0GW58_9ACTN|nr:hypothetical protein [Motilibacter deserti]NHC15154.1 hypothetical protein [Motilibacter deserti]
MPARHPVRRLGLCAAAAAGLVVGVPAVASAHPFGPPLTAKLSAQGSSVELELHAEPDDWMAIGQLVHAFDDVSGDTSTTGEQRLVTSPKFAAYVLDNVRVRQHGVDCTGTVEPRPSLLKDGIVVVADCPADVETVTVDITTLHDVHENYRTVASGDGVPQTLFTSTDSSHDVAFTGGSSAPLPGLLTAGGILAVGAVGAVALPLLRRRTREASRA